MKLKEQLKVISKYSLVELHIKDDEGYDVVAYRKTKDQLMKYEGVRKRFNANVELIYAHGLVNEEEDGSASCEPSFIVFAKEE